MYPAGSSNKLSMGLEMLRIYSPIPPRKYLSSAPNLKDNIHCPAARITINEVDIKKNIGFNLVLSLARKFTKNAMKRM